jgi:hypothetical protein
MTKIKKNYSKPAVALSPIDRAGSTFSDSVELPERGPLGPANAPNTPTGEAPNMAY